MTTVEAPKAVVPGTQIWPLSVQAYHVLGEAGLIPKKTELLYGQVIHKMPKTPLHSFLQQSLSEIIQAAQLPGMFLRSDQPITCADSEPEPDLAVVQGRKEDYRHGHPRTAELVIEVCVTSHDYDRSKLHAYSDAGVKEVWLVLGPEKQIEVHGRPAGGRFEERALHGPGGQLTSAAVPRIAVDLAALFAS